MSLTSQPVLKVVEPHLGQVTVALPHHVLDGAEGLVQAEQGSLGTRVVEAALGDDEHVVEGEVLELGRDEGVRLGVPRHDVRQVEPVMHHGGAVEAQPQQCHEQHCHHRLRGQRGVSGRVPRHPPAPGGTAGAVPTSPWSGSAGGAGHTSPGQSQRGSSGRRAGGHTPARPWPRPAGPAGPGWSWTGQRPVSPGGRWGAGGWQARCTLGRWAAGR